MAESDEVEAVFPKPIRWRGSNLKDLRTFPAEVRQTIGQALFDAQIGRKHTDAKPLKGFGGAGVLEIVENDDGNAYRAIYTVKFARVIYVLHTFQKKSKRGAKTPSADVETIKRRLREAEVDYAEWSRNRSAGQEHH